MQDPNTFANTSIRQLGIVIITYNRPVEMLALVKNIAALKNADSILQEVIILNNASTESYAEVTQFINTAGHIPFRYFDWPENLGVSRGRNVAAQKALAPYLLFLDDDAEFQSDDSLEKIVPMLNENEHNKRPVGAISLKVLYYDILQMQVNAFPHKKFKERHQWKKFDTYYYTGLAHILKKEALEKTGYYPTNFFYGMEEYDLSYRILDLGYRIVYNSDVVVLHKESPLGRTTKKEKLEMMWVNKSKVAYKYLPKINFYSTATMWSLEYLNKSGFDIAGFIQGWKKVFSIPKNEKRALLGKATLKYLRDCEARLWY